MAGNEKEIAQYLVSQKDKLSLRHLGIIKSVGAPNTTKSGFIEIETVDDVAGLLATEDPRKKADIYINSQGVSLKQTGSSFSYNRLQRANLLKVFVHLGFTDSSGILQKLDLEIKKYHDNKLDRRNRPWQDFFSETDFKALLKYLMMDGAPNVGDSGHPAKYILEAHVSGIKENSIEVFSFDGYFDKYKQKFKIALRRQWVGQASNSEHKRATGLAGKDENAPWVFNDVVGKPRTGWRERFPVSNRKTVYFLMIEKER